MEFEPEVFKRYTGFPGYEYAPPSAKAGISPSSNVIPQPLSPAHAQMVIEAVRRLDDRTPNEKDNA